MVDDWSLKGKSEILDERGLIHFEEDDDYDDYFYFSKYDIEILRVKLIKDLERAWKHIDKQEDKTNREYWFMTEWKSSLDRRFGVI